MASPKSNKNKGRTGQKEVQALILEAFPELEPDDCRSNPMGSDGEDILLSPAARKLMPWNIEVKRKKQVGAARFMEQANCHGNYKPVAFFREDRGPWYSIVESNYLFELMQLKQILLDMTAEMDLVPHEKLKEECLKNPEVKKLYDEEKE